jgi:hypothetical protein
MAVHDGGRRRGLAGNAEQDGRDVSGRGSHGSHAEQEGERLDRLHREDEGQHQGERGRPAESRQDADRKAERDADQHQAQRRRSENLEQTRGEGPGHLGEHLPSRDSGRLRHSRLRGSDEWRSATRR